VKPPRSLEAILRERARQLAIPNELEEHETEELATFLVGGCTLAVPLAQVRHASTLRHVTEIPGGPPWLVGLVAVEGQLVSLLHVPRFLGIERQGLGDISATLVATWGERAIGLAAEQLLGIEDIDADDIVELPVAIGPIRRTASSRAGRELLIFDVRDVFADARLGRESR
jgi:purine-binding chemotaxis protein CheW